MKRKLLGVFAALGLTLAVLGATVAPADAWLHTANTVYNYKAPGPPPGPSGDHCKVTTSLSYSWDVNLNKAYIFKQGSGAGCVAICVQAVFYTDYAGIGLFNGPYTCSYGLTAFSYPTYPAPPGTIIFGASYQAYSNTILDQWQVSILG